MRTKKTIILKNKKGQALVEFAIVIPVYLLMILCFIQLIFVMYAKLMLDYAAYQAVRAGVVNKGNEDYMKNAAKIALSPLHKRIKSFNDIKEVTKKTYICWDCDICPLQFSLQASTDLKKKIKTATMLKELTQEERVLKVKLEYNFPLFIPVANQIIASLAKGFLGSNNMLKGSSWFYPDQYSEKHIKKSKFSYPFNNKFPTIELSSISLMKLTTLTTPPSKT